METAEGGKENDTLDLNHLQPEHLQPFGEMAEVGCLTVVVAVVEA
jgi:hypothetical protein